MDIKGYRIEKVIGRGGMATVYLAVQTALERHVALKVMNPAFANDREFTTRFLQEGPIAAKLSDPQIVTVYDSGVDQKHYYLAMEYLPGGTLKQKIRDGLPIEKTLNIIKLLAKGLSYAHSQKVLHRDIKPQNILFRASGEPVLTDFGIAKALTQASHLTVPGTAFGSPKYMSPEQAKGAGLDHRSDLYSLGVVFYEMLAGRPPFESKDAITLAQMHITDAVPPLPERLAVFQPLIDRLLSKDPNARFQSAEEFLSALKDVRHRYELDMSSSNRLSVDVTQVRMSDRSRQTIPSPPKRSAIPKLLTGFAVLAAAVIGGGYIYQTYNKDDPRSTTTGTNNATASQPSPVETALVTAREQQQQGELEQSLQTVRNALQQAPEHGQLLALENELEQALAARQQAASQAAAAEAEAKLAESIAKSLSKARQLRRQGELEQSLALVQEALQQSPEHPELLTLEQELQNTIADLDRRRQAAAHLATAQKALQQNDLNSALTAAQQGLELIPDHLELLALQTQIGQKQAALEREQQVFQVYQQAQQQLQQNQPEAALSSLQEALKLKPDDERLTALRDEILAIQAQAELEHQLRQQIAQLLEQAQSQFNQLQLTTPEGNNAYETYQQVLAQDPNNQEALAGVRKIAAKYFELADQAHAADDTDKALDYLNRGLSVQSDNPELLALQDQIQRQQTARDQLALGRELFAAQQLEDSLSAVDAGLAAVSDDTELLALRGEILQALDQREKQLIAQSALADARQLGQQNEWRQALAVLDRALAEAPQHADLIALREQLRQEQSKHEQQLAAEQHLAAAQQLLGNSELSAAYAEIQQGLQLVPEHADLLALKSQIEKQQAVTTVLERAQTFAAAGQLENSLALVQRGLDLDPENPSLLSLRDQLRQDIEALRIAAQAAAEQAAQQAANNAAPEDTTAATSSTAPAEPDLVVFGQGLASLAQQMGLRDAESFLRERVDTLAQEQTSTAPSASPATTANNTIADTPNSDALTADSTTETSDDPVQTAAVTEPSDPLLEQAENLLEPANNAASDSTQADDNTTDSETDTLETQIAELLQTADTRLAKLNLTTPRGQSAYDAYRQVLQLDPDNRAAQQGIQNIVNRYQRWAINQREKGNFDRSLGNINKALRVDPDNRELQSLRQTVIAQQQAAEAARQQDANDRQTRPRPATDPCEIDRGSKECWCKTLKMFCN